jgi:hypothetical protein
MSELDFRIGAQVVCEDKSCGHVAKLVVDPHTQRVTDVIVEQGVLFKRDTVVPVDIVGAADEDGVRLTLPKDQLGRLPAYQEHEYATPPKALENLDYQPEHLLHRVTLRQRVLGVPLVARLRYHVHAGIAPEEIVVQPGLAVHGLDGQIGTLDHLLIDTQSGDTRMLVVDRGFMRTEVAIPAELNQQVTEAGIEVNLRAAQIGGLHHTRRRATEDTFAEVGYWLRALPVAPGSVHLELEGGVARLRGCVPDVRTKRLIEARVRTVEGIVDVDNQLEVTDTIRARVTAALRTDPRTDVACIDITVQQGIVTLAGEVDSPAIVQAAGEIAAEQQGVTQVANELVVQGDEHSVCLRHRHGTTGQPA